MMHERGSQPNRRLSVKTHDMRRWIITIALLSLLAGAVGFVAIAMHSGEAGSRRSRTDLAFVHRVRPEATQAVALGAAPLARTLSAATKARVIVGFATTLWLVTGTFLLVPVGSFLRPARRRRAPPLFVT